MAMTMDRKAIEQTKRTLEAFAYIAEKNKNKDNIYNVLKVFYLADKIHMERFGRFIFDESYAAMDKGPVPSHAYNLIQQLIRHGNLACELESPVRVVGVKVVVERQFDDELFSDSDLECIDEVIEISRTKDLGELSHDSAWEKARNLHKHFMPDEYILDSLGNSELLKSLVSNRY